MTREEKANRIVELRKSGASYKQIAEDLGFKTANDGFLSKILREAGLTKTATELSERNAIMRERIAAGVSVQDVAKEFLVQEYTVRLVCNHEIETHKADLHQAMREYKAQGHTHREVADKFGISEARSQAICKGISPQKNLRPQQYRNGYSGIDKDLLGRKLIEERAPMFEYVSGYTTSDGFADVRCKVCGAVLHKSCVALRHRKAECENCKRIAAKQKEEQQEIETDKRRWAKSGKHKAKQLSFSVCKGCGCLFFSDRLGVLYCSDSCAKRVMNARAKDKRIKKLSTIIVDKNITLERLFEKNNGVCALCGGQCNWSDHLIKDNGAFVAGATYPSIDHIRPISKGGLHEWKNVQLAHFYCNTMKGDNL